MTATGSGVGGNIGGPQIPLQYELETTAWTNINKAALGIVPDSIEKAFVEMNPRYSVGYLGGFGYRTTAQNPLLDHPLESLRRSELRPQMKDDAWLAAFDHLVSQLPPDLLARFNSELRKPFEERDLSFTALDNLFRSTAKTLTQMDRLAQPTPIGSLEETRAMINLLLPIVALKGAIANGNEILDAAQNFLQEQGANYRYFDGFSNLLAKLQAPMNIFEGINANLGTALNGQLTPEAIAAAAKAAGQLAKLRTQLERISLGNDLQMLLATVKAMETVASALSLPNTATAPLFVATSLASVGLFASNGSKGMLGPVYQSLLNNINSALTTGLMPLNNKAGNELLSQIIALSLVVFSGLGTLTVDSGLGLYPQKDPQTLNAAHTFAFAIALQLAVNSGFIETFYREIIDVSGGDANAQRLGGSVLAQLAHLMIILTGSNESKTNPAQFIEEEANSMKQGINAAAEIEKSKQSEKTANAAIAIQLATLALESHDYEGFLDALDNILGSIGASLETLNREIIQSSREAKEIANVIGQGNPNEQLTRIENII